ncbi:MCP four helix bundle domain-containing protein [Aquabacterium sp. CECT 9606]|uniref:MCP four helix bundle domain-containing protein n=1 Tax=Aquabacterium sp. CECT 9606 TaxID=2845822 RepID=UPI001E2C480A|nr:hypothetical protein AQB9606_03108 [Aquabacterium sp. CECT 9606]
MKLNHLKISQRLALAFGLITVLLVASSGLALHELGSVEQSLDSIATGSNVKVKQNNEMAESVHVVSRVIRTMVLLHEKDEVRAEEIKLKQARAHYDKIWDTQQKLPASEADKAIRSKIARAAEAARGLNNSVIELAHAGKDEQAIAVLLKEAGPATQKWQDALDEYIAPRKAKPNGNWRWPPWATTKRVQF